MSLGNLVARGWHVVADNSKGVPFGVASVGMVSTLMVDGAVAQTPSNDQLPPVQVQAPRAAARKAAPARSAPAQKAAPVVAMPPAAPAPSPVPTTESFTPATGNTLQSGTGIGRLPGTVQSTPQVINVIPQQQLQEQGTSSVEQALRNVPGVTLAMGEGGGALNGDQFRIRGFEAKGDMYVDGLRDFGVYVRDSFAIEEVAVLKGPSSETFGNGTTGGVINLRQKSAHLGDAGSVDLSIGSGMMYRSVVDVNKQVGTNMAMRAVAMYHGQDTVDRDHVEANRWGFLGSIAFGLKTDTTWTINYMHQSGDRTPDYGVPLVSRSGATRGGLPVTEFGVPRSNFYGQVSDRDQYDIDMLTSKFQMKINPYFTFNNDTRLAFSQREFATTVPSCANTVGGCSDQFFAGGNPFITLGGGNPAYNSKSWGIQNVSSFTAKFHTAALRHELVAGIDVFYSEDDRLPLTQVGKITGSTPIRNPDVRYYGGYSLVRNPTADRFADGTEVGLFASDRIWLTKELSILGGVRWTSFESNSIQPRSTTNSLPVQSSADYYSPKASVIWEPTKEQTYYVSWARSANPVGQYVTNSPTTITAAVANQVDESESKEIGAKFNLLNGTLGLTAALFEVEKGNAVAVDALGVVTQTGEVQRVRGAELGMTGQITPAWRMNAAYAYLDSEVIKSLTPANIGNAVGGVPEHSVNLWTTYDLTKGGIVGGPGTWVVGGGLRYQSFQFTTGNANNNLYGVPASFVVDALVSYELSGWKAALNGYNLTDELYYAENSGNRIVPASGRSVIFTLSKKF